MAMTYSKLSPLPSPLPTAASLSSCSTLTPASATRIEPPSLDPASSSSRSRRLPKAPVFINRKPPEPNTLTSFITETDGATEQPASIHMEEPDEIVESRVYDYDDDFPSIAASESTAPPPEPVFVRRARERVRRRDLSPTLAPHNSAHLPPSSSCRTNTGIPPTQDRQTSSVHDRSRSRSRSRVSRSRARSRSRRRGTTTAEDDEDNSQIMRRRRFRDVDDNFAHHIPGSTRRGMRASAGSTIDGSRPVRGEPHQLGHGKLSGMDGLTGIHYSRTGKTSFAANNDRMSFASSLKRRVSLHYSRSRGDGSSMGAAPRRSYGSHRAHHLEDSILHDWRESRMKDAAAAAEAAEVVEATAQSPGISICSGRKPESGRRAGFFQGFFNRGDRRTAEIDGLTERMREMDAETNGGLCKMVVEDRKKREEIQLVSSLAYDDFMHGQSQRNSAASRVFSRLRRS